MKNLYFILGLLIVATIKANSQILPEAPLFSKAELVYKQNTELYKKLGYREVSIFEAPIVPSGVQNVGASVDKLYQTYYDHNGRITEIIEKTDDGKIRHYYNYIDENSVKIKTYQKSDVKLNVYYTVEYLYDKSGLLINCQITDTKSKTKTEVKISRQSGTNRMVIDSIINGTITAQAIYQFPNGFDKTPTAYEWKNALGNVLKKVNLAYYDNGAIKEEITLNNESKIDQKKQYVYDKFGNLTMMRTLNSRNTTQMQINYKYDTEGKIIDGLKSDMAQGKAAKLITEIKIYSDLRQTTPPAK